MQITEILAFLIEALYNLKFHMEKKKKNVSFQFMLSQKTIFQHLHETL